MQQRGGFVEDWVCSEVRSKNGHGEISQCVVKRLDKSSSLQVRLRLFSELRGKDTSRSGVDVNSPSSPLPTPTTKLAIRNARTDPVICLVSSPLGPTLCYSILMELLIGLPPVRALSCLILLVGVALDRVALDHLERCLCSINVPSLTCLQISLVSLSTAVIHSTAQC